MNSFTINGKTLCNEPAPTVPNWFLLALKRIGGQTDFGADYLKLVWGQSELVYAYGEQRMKYLACSAMVKTGTRINIVNATIEDVLERIDIGRPRWFVEEWTPPGLLEANYDEEVFGQFPEQGKWRHFLTLETPDGQYREPDLECLEWIEELWQERLKRRHLHNKDERESDFYFAQRMRDAAYSVEKVREKKEEELHDRFKSLLAPHIHRLTKRNPREGYDAHTRRKTSSESASDK